MSDSNFRHLKASTIRGVATAKNYIKNAFASENVNQWATYSNTAQATPVTGTGSSGGSQTVAQVTTSNSTLNSTSVNQWTGQSFTTSTATTILSASMSLDYVTAGGSPTGSMFIGVYDTSGPGGSPGTLLGTSNSTDASTIPHTTPSDIVFTFTSGPALLASTQYWIVLQPTGVTFNGSTIEINRDNTNPYAGGTATLSLDGGSTYTAIPGSDVRFNVTGTGGINVTLTRNTSSPLRNEADFLFTKDAANRQGQGVSYNFTIDKADKSKRLSVQFDYLASANFVTGTASDMQVFLYDVTNSVLIYPDSSSILIASGTYQAGFQTTSSTSYRLIFHIATTNALAYTLEFTNVSVSQNPLLVTSNPNHNFMSGYTAGSTFSVAGGSFQNFTPSSTTTFTQVLNEGMGAITTAASNLPGITFTPINPNASYRITAKYSGFEGTNAQGWGTRLWDGTNVIDDSVYAVNADPVNTAGGVVTFSVINEGIYSPGTTSPVTITLQGFTSGATLEIPSTGGPATINWTVEQLTGYDAVASATNSNLSMANILANGTIVTGSSPTAIGQYRPQLRNTNSFTFTDTNATPSPLPTAANGIPIWTNGPATGGDANNQPSRYEIFVGVSKTFRLQFYSSTGRSGFIDVTPNSPAGSTDVGIFHAYNPTTGVLELVASHAGGEPTSYVGQDPTNQASSFMMCYFDIIVADNEFQIQVPNTAVGAYLTASGTITPGGPNAIVKFDTVQDDTNNAYSTSTGLYTVPFAGRYLVTLTVNVNSQADFYIKKNGVAYPNGSVTFVNTATFGSGSIMVKCNAGDTIGLYIDSAALVGAANTNYTIYRLGT